MTRQQRRRSAVDRDDDGHPVLVLRGEFDLSTVDELDRLLTEVAAGAPAQVVIDLRDAEFMDCAGARPIAEWRRRLPAQGCGVVLRLPSRSVRMVLEALGLDGPCVIEG